MRSEAFIFSSHQLDKDMKRKIINTGIAGIRGFYCQFVPVVVGPIKSFSEIKKWKWIDAQPAVVRVNFFEFIENSQENRMKLKGADLFVKEEENNISLQLIVHGVDSKNTVDLISGSLWTVLSDIEPRIKISSEVRTNLN